MAGIDLQTYVSTIHASVARVFSPFPNEQFSHHVRAGEARFIFHVHHACMNRFSKTDAMESSLKSSNIPCACITHRKPFRVPLLPTEIECSTENIKPRKNSCCIDRVINGFILVVSIVGAMKGFWCLAHRRVIKIAYCP